MSKHYPLTPELARQLRSAKLTAAEWHVWSYLVTLDPFGENYQEIDLLVILSECEISKPTFYRAIARLQELEFIDTQPAKFAFRNLIGARRLLSENSIKNEKVVSKMRKQSQKRDPSIKNEKVVSKMRKQSQERDKFDLKALQELGSITVQIDHTFHTDQTLSEARPPTPEREEKVFDEEELIEFVTRQVDREINFEKKVVRALRPYAKKCLRVDREFWLKRYRQYLEQQDQIKCSAPPSTLFEPETIEQRRERLLKLWETPPCRPGIKKAIAAAPELKLEIVGDELREVEP